MKTYALVISVVLAAFLCGSCRNSKPPKISLICLGDGYGGADCVDPAGNKIYKSPSDLKDFWMTTQVDEANYSAWCYDTSVSNTTKAMQVMNARITSRQWTSSAGSSASK